MAFQGDLHNIGLATVFQNLHQNLQTGTLKLRRSGDERFVFVKEGKIAMLARAGFETPLDEYLIRAGKVTHEDIDPARKKRRKGSRLGSALERAGAVAGDDVKKAVSQFVEEGLYDLFTWSDGSFEFQEGDAPRDVFDAEVRAAGLSLEPNRIIIEAARRVDEWERINRVVGSLRDIYVVRSEMVEELDKLKDPYARRVAEFLDGRREVAAVIRDSALGRFAVCHGLSRLVTDRFVRLVSADEIARLAEAAQSSNEIDEAARLLKKGLELERSDVALRRKLAEILDSAGEKEEAASEWKLLASSLLDGGRTAEAADALRRAIALRPTDVAVRERLFQILFDSGGKTVAIETGMSLADTYVGLGFSEKARDALQRMLGLGPKDRLAIERKLVEANLALGDVKGAVGTLRKIARRSLKSRDYEDAALVYEEILKLDAKDAEARKRIAEIQAGVVERMIERRRALIWAAVLAAVAGPLLVFVARELASRPAETDARVRAVRVGAGAARELGRGQARLEEGLRSERKSDDKRFRGAAESFKGAAQGFEQAAGIVADFRSSFAWTLASRSAAREVAEWRLRAARARLASAAAHERAFDLAEAYLIYRKLGRTPGVPAGVARTAEAAAARLRSTVGDLVEIQE